MVKNKSLVYVSKFPSGESQKLMTKFEKQKLKKKKGFVICDNLIQFYNTKRSLLGIPSKREGFIQPSITSQFPKFTAFNGNWIAFWACEREKIQER